VTADLNIPLRADSGDWQKEYHLLTQRYTAGRMKMTDLHPRQPLGQLQQELEDWVHEDFLPMELPECDVLKLPENVNMV
jgi:hypothetical protein